MIDIRRLDRVLLLNSKIGTTTKKTTTTTTEVSPTMKVRMKNSTKKTKWMSM